MELEKGKILISEPYLPDNNFSRSVVLLCEHDETGSVGFVLNRQIPPSLSEVLKLDNLDYFPTYEGGPVDTNGLFYIHTYKQISGAVPVKDDLCWGGDFNEILIMVQDNLINENEIRFFIGYSGWSPGQLEQELEIGSWFVSDLGVTDILQDNAETLWRKCVAKLSNNNKIWADAPLNPYLN